MRKLLVAVVPALLAAALLAAARPAPDDRLSAVVGGMVESTRECLPAYETAMHWHLEVATDDVARLVVLSRRYPDYVVPVGEDSFRTFARDLVLPPGRYQVRLSVCDYSAGVERPRVTTNVIAILEP